MPRALVPALVASTLAACATTSPAPHTAWPVAQVRIARQTDRLEEVVRFYRDGLGLPVLAGFRDHDGVDGAMLGLPGSDYHLEFTHNHAGSPGTAPTKENLLVLYFPADAERERVIARLKALGNEEVEPENPYWRGKSATFADPDGWRVVLFKGTFTPSPESAPKF